MSNFPFCCSPVGNTGSDSVVHTIENVGGAAEWYVIGTGPNPFQIRTAESSDASITITQGVSTVDFVADFGGNVSVINVGGFSEWFRIGTVNPFEFRTFQSSDGSATITQNANDIDITVPTPAGAEVFQVDGTLTKSTGLATYQQVEILATDPNTQIKNGDNWKINLCIFICHPTALFSINTWVRWSIETAAGVFTPIDEWQVNWPIAVGVGEPSAPAHRTVDVVIAFDDPRMLCEVKMSAVSGAPTQVEEPRWGGVQIEAAP